MKENNFASAGEIRQFLAALLTSVIVVTFYHIGCSVMDFLKNSGRPQFSIIHCCNSPNTDE